jgi:hypothetical protein
VFEELDRAFVFQRRLSALERAQVPPDAGLRIGPSASRADMPDFSFRIIRMSQNQNSRTETIASAQNMAQANRDLVSV